MTSIVPLIAILWLIAFPVIVIVNADLVLPYLMCTVYAGMVLLGWAVAASVMGGFGSTAILMSVVCVGWVLYSLTSERRYRAETHGSDLGSVGRRAKAEGLATYSPAWMNIAAGAVAGAMLGCTPALFSILHGLLAPADQAFSQGIAAFLAMGSDQPSMTGFTVFVAVVGAIAAWLRRSRGFARQMVWPLKGTYVRRRPDSAMYDKFLLYWWPVLSFFALAAASREVMVVVMSFFFVWVFSGVLFRPLWAGLHNLILKAMGAFTERRLDYEYVLRVRLENDPSLRSCTYSDIRVNQDRSVQVIGHFKTTADEESATRLIESVVRRSAGRVRLVEESS